MMDFRERFLTAMNHEEPDRVPVMGLVAEPAMSNAILGKAPIDLVSMLADPGMKEQIKEIIGSSWNEVLYGNFADCLEAAIKLGFDANWTIYTHMKLVDDPDFRSGLAWHDIHGRVWEQRVDERGNVVMNYVRGTCANEEEWHAWVERNGPLFDDFIRGAAVYHRRLADSYRDRIVPVVYTDTGIFESTWQTMGFVNFTRLVYQRPDFIRKVIEFKTDLYLRYMRAMMESGADVVLGGDDLAHKTGPLMRPQLMEELFGESYRRVSDLVHSQNRKLIWHSCGNVTAFLPKFIEWGFDGVFTLEPTAGMELGKVREQVGHRLVLVGNLDVSHLLVRGTREEVDAAVRKAIAEAAPGGGYILSPSHSHTSVDPMRLEWMIEAAHRYGSYPIAL